MARRFVAVAQGTASALFTFARRQPKQQRQQQSSCSHALHAEQSRCQSPRVSFSLLASLSCQKTESAARVPARVPTLSHANSFSRPGSLCHSTLDTCSPDGIGSECRPACTAPSYNPGFRCNAQKACEPIPCDEGCTCPSYQRCDAVAAHAMGPVHAKTNGCVDIVCSTEKDCPAGKTCVNSACADGPGMCQRDLPVP